MKLKQFAAWALTGILLAGCLSGCGTTSYDRVLTVDGEAITPGLYRMVQIQSYVQAAEKISSMADTIDGKTASDWIYDHTVTLLRARRYYQQQFDAQGLSFTAAEQDAMDKAIAASWSTAAAVYEKNGVTEAAYRDSSITAAKAKKLFEAYCADLTDDEVRSYLEQHFVYIEYTQLPRINRSGAALSAEDLAAVDKLAAAALQKLAAGDGSDFAKVCATAVAGAYPLGGFTAPDAAGSASYLRSAYLSLDGSGDEFSNALAAQVQSVAVGGCGLYRDDQFIVLFHRLPNYETETGFQSLRSSVLSQMRGSAWETACAAVWDTYDVTADERAVAFYDPKKLDLSDSSSSAAGAGAASAALPSASPAG